VALSARPQYRLDLAAPPPVVPPELDDAQRAVVTHPGGPLLVLAGPGTGKTTTLVEAVAARVAAGLDPSRILVLTFSRKAAAELRDRISGRLGRTTAGPAAATFGSFCFGLVTAEFGPLRLLSGAEQEVAVRDLLAGSVAEDLTRLAWPAEIAGAIGTRGLAEEVRDVLARVAARDVDLARIAAADPPRTARWSALAQFAETYLDVLEARGVLDHAELVRRAVALAEEPGRRARLREQYAAVFVDEYQDVDPAQVRLLQALAGDGRDLVVFGDPDQSIYAFRGARVREILGFPDTFADRTGHPAPVRVLRTSRRCGPRLLAAGREVARRLPLAGLPAEAARTHRDLRAAGDLPGEIAVATYPSVGAELEHVADTLRRAHLQDGLPWSQMAVLVRSGTRSIPALRRVLGSAGVPFAVASDELPLRSEPAAAVLLTALGLAADPMALTAEVARELLLSPLGGLDPVHLRGLGRALRARARASEESRVAPSAQLLCAALLEPAMLAGVEVPGAAAARACAALFGRARELAAAGAGAEAVLWAWWSGTDWPDRLARAAAGRGPAAARADRDLDAVCALFAQAARAGEQPGGGGPRTFLAAVAAQQIPSDPPSAGDGPGEAVRVMTAHRSKGLEWDLVVVAGVQEGVWPDLRRRGSFLDADRITEHGLGEPTTVAELLAEERRLFYVAVTRARRRLLVTAVATPDESGDRPSRFLRELGVEPVVQSGRPARPLSPGGLVGELRAVLIDTDAAPALRRAAADRLAVLARAAGADGVPLVSAAHPDRWWGLVEPSAATDPVRDPARPVELTPSAVDGLRSCPLQWFLRREVHAEQAAGAALGFGNVLHALAEEVAAGAPADLDSLTARLDTVWSELAYDAPWQSREQREAALTALRLFLAWHTERPDRTLLGAEVEFDITLDAGGEPVRLRGRLDRVERDAAGGVRVVDFKTNKSAPTGAEVAEHAQLGVYQQVVAHRGLVDLPGAGDSCGGAELVMLRQEQGRTGLPKVLGQQPPAQTDDPGWVARMLADAARRVRGERFGPQPSDDCDRCPYRRCCPARPEGAQVVS
jgi:superfamily I DNA/RNA helicase/RecB family exonuclease